MGYSSESGWRVNLEYVYINQNELRSGTSTATPAEVVNHPFDPALNGGEIEQDTINRYLNLGLSYRPNADWNLSLIAPWVIRGHSTYGVQTRPYSPAETAPDQLSYSDFSQLGDIRVLAAYQGLLPTHNLGIQLGLKLPTGSYGTAVNFLTGPNAGAPIDASLQPGTGSTDVIIGSYYFQPISQDFDAFAAIDFQAAVAHQQDQPGNDFRPGNSLTASFGVRYEAHPRWVPQLQINLYERRADQGALADVLDTNGFVAYVSPGLSVRVVQHLQVYGLVQVPVYSNLGGYQLFPHWTGTVGFSYGM